jgi:glutathione S-transferase
MHYAEGSAMLPLMLNMYVRRLKEAGAPLQPRIDSEIANHLGYIDASLAGRDYLLGEELSGADIQMSFVGEVAQAMGRRASYANLDAWTRRLHGRPAFKTAIDKAGPYNLGQ